MVCKSKHCHAMCVTISRQVCRPRNIPAFISVLLRIMLVQEHVVEKIYMYTFNIFSLYMYITAS